LNLQHISKADLRDLNVCNVMEAFGCF
jgi:hypothetical protein